MLKPQSTSKSQNQEKMINTIRYDKVDRFLSKKK